MDPPDRIRRLEHAGVPFTLAPPEIRQVLASLTDEEIDVLAAIKRRLEAVTPDVQSHIIGGLLW